jgi:hypothetical protein
VIAGKDHDWVLTQIFRSEDGERGTGDEYGKPSPKPRDVVLNSSTPIKQGNKERK